LTKRKRCTGASAILTAPAFLSGLSGPELALVKHRVEQHLGPEIVNAKAATLKALEQAEAGWQTAMRKIAERGRIRPLVRKLDAHSPRNPRRELLRA
jgi:hypothetical protein